jgi:nucleoside-diphosphate-sugar epimerase
VSCLARGRAGEIADGAHLLAADRSEPGAYDEASAQDWDLVVDVSWQPGFVHSALAALADRAARWAYVSSVSVYAANDTAGADESAELQPALTEPTATIEQYGAAKVACEQACRALRGDNVLLARAGLIGGYGDGTDRFGYWPWRFDRDPDADVLVPDAADLPTQTIDVADLAGWILTAGLAGATGAFNAVGPSHTLGEVFAASRRATGHGGRVVRADETFLTEHDVNPWAGPRSLPLWVPGAAMSGFAARDRSAAVAAGLTDSGLDTLVERSLAWERAQPADRRRQAGLTDAEQAELLAALAAG